MNENKKINFKTKKELIKTIKSLKLRVTYKENGSVKRDYNNIIWNNCLVEVENLIEKF